MNRNPVLLVDEFLRSDEARLRKNGVVALGAITGAACTERLIEIALNDPDAQVREAAEKELTALLRESGAELVAVYEKAADQPERRSRIYALAGRLRSKGASIEAFPTGLRSELTLFFAACPSRGWKFYFRALPAALGGAIALFVILQLVLGIVAVSGGFFAGVSGELVYGAFTGLLLGVIGAILASVFTTAYGFRISLVKGLLVEVLLAMCIPAALYGLVAILVVLVMGTADITMLLKIGAVLLIAIASARAFTIFAAGSARSRIGNVLKSTRTGSAGAIVLSTAAILPLFGHDADLVSIAWVVAVPGCGAAAAAFASIDARTVITVRPRVYRVISRLFALLTSIVAVVLLVSLYLGNRAVKESLQKLPIGETVQSSQQADAIRVTVLPYRARLMVKERRLVSARPSSYERLRLIDSNGKTIENSRYGFARDLSPGTYDVYYMPTSAEELTPTEALPRTLRAFVTPFLKRSWRSAPAMPQTSLETPRVLSLEFKAPIASKGPLPLRVERDYAATDTMMTSGTMPIATADNAAQVAADQRRAHASARVERAATQAKEGKLALAFTDIRDARKIDPNVVIDAGTWNTLCWQSAIRREATSVVDDACESAVTLDPENADYRDSRGLARALAGRKAGAIEDFQAYMSSAEPADQRAQRARWVKELQAGRNPFTDAELKTLYTP